MNCQSSILCAVKLDAIYSHYPLKTPKVWYQNDQKFTIFHFVYELISCCLNNKKGSYAPPSFIQIKFNLLRFCCFNMEAAIFSFIFEVELYIYSLRGTIIKMRSFVLSNLKDSPESSWNLCPTASIKHIVSAKV